MNSNTERGAAIKRTLKTAFPGVTFSVRGSRGTGYGWFDVSWTDGPTMREVDAALAGFAELGRWNNGNEINTRRRVSDAA